MEVCLGLLKMSDAEKIVQLEDLVSDWELSLNLSRNGVKTVWRGTSKGFDWTTFLPLQKQKDTHSTLQELNYPSRQMQEYLSTLFLSHDRLSRDSLLNRTEIEWKWISTTDRPMNENQRQKGNSTCKNLRDKCIHERVLPRQTQKTDWLNVEQFEWINVNKRKRKNYDAIF